MVTRCAPTANARRIFRSSKVVPRSGVSGLQAEAACKRDPRPAARITASIALSGYAHWNGRDELLDGVIGLIVRHLARWVFTEIHRWCIQHPSLSALQCQLGATNHIDCHPRRV